MVMNAGSYEHELFTTGMILKNKEHVKSAAPKMSTVTSRSVEKWKAEELSVCICDQLPSPTQLNADSRETKSFYEDSEEETWQRIRGCIF